MKNLKIKDCAGNEWNCVAIISRLAIVVNERGRYVIMHSDTYEYGLPLPEDYTFGSGNVTEYRTLEDAVNGIHPKNLQLKQYK